MKTLGETLLSKTLQGGEEIKAGTWHCMRFPKHWWKEFETAVANQSGAMEAETITKNGRNLKSQKSKGNITKGGI